ncbi:Uncharacterised protein [uncultured Clostridium sp.]|nr:Uncharacterised protein [uncultured Clostridium sp.]
MLLSGLISKYKTICKENRRHLSEISKIEILILLVMISAAIVYILNVIIIKENNVIALVIATLIFVITSVLENIIWYNRYGKRAEYYKNQHLQRVKQMLRAQGLERKDKIEILLGMIEDKCAEKSGLLYDLKPILIITLIVGPLYSTWVGIWLTEAITTANINMLIMYGLCGAMIYVTIITTNLIFSGVLSRKKNLYRAFREDLKNILLLT